MSHDHDHDTQAPGRPDLASVRGGPAGLTAAGSHGTRRRRLARGVGLGVLTASVLTLSVSCSDAGTAGTAGDTATAAASTAAPSTSVEPTPEASAEPALAFEAPDGPVEVVPADALIAQATAAAETTPDAILQVTARSSSSVGADLDSVAEVRSAVAPDGSWTLTERLTDLSRIGDEPLVDVPRAPGAPATGAWETRLEADGTWSSVVVDRTVGIWSSESTTTDPVPTVSGTTIGADGAETASEWSTNGALSAMRSFRSIVQAVQGSEHGYAVVEGSESVQDVGGSEAVCVDYVVTQSVTPAEYDRHGELCVDPVSGAARKLVSSYSQGGPGGPDGYASDEASTYTTEQVFDWYVSTPENERFFEVAHDGLAKVGPEALSGVRSFFESH